MCTVSMVGDMWQREIPQRAPYMMRPFSEVTRAEFEALKRDIEALKELLQAAKKYDEATGQPDCEMDEKVHLIRRVAELVGVDIGCVFEASEKGQEGNEGNASETRIS